MTKSYLVTFDVITYADNEQQAINAARRAVKQKMEGSVSCVEDA